jgi:hypothetical protein
MRNGNGNDFNAGALTEGVAFDSSLKPDRSLNAKQIPAAKCPTSVITCQR